MSPHVFEIDGKSMHYKMPINAISSITNRATGVAMTVGAYLPEAFSQLMRQQIIIASMQTGCAPSTLDTDRVV